MASLAAGETGNAPAAAQGRNVVGTLLFMGLFLFMWITIAPYVDLTTDASMALKAELSNSLNQIIALGLFFALLVYGLCHPLRGTILRPHVLYGLLFSWMLAGTVLSNAPVLSVKALVLSVMSITNAAIFLLLPRDEGHFARMIGTGALIALGFAYFGVAVWPEFSIHQASEIREPMNAGFWRGHFPHKNVAAGHMVVSAFIGLYVMKTWSRPIGLMIFVLSAWFLVHTGGKTASAMLPAVLILGWLFERLPPLRLPIAVGGVLVFNLVAVGAAVNPSLRELVTDLGIDATFTNRSDIWRLAFTAISERWLTGYGLNAFWQMPELVHSGGSVESWAVAAYNGHNAYLDIWLHTGLPGLVLAMIMLLFLPLRDLSRIDDTGTHDNVTRLFTRIWLYSLYNACLESLFFANGSGLWFMMLIAVMSFRLRAATAVIAAPARGKA